MAQTLGDDDMIHSRPDWVEHEAFIFNHDINPADGINHLNKCIEIYLSVIVDRDTHKLLDGFHRQSRPATRKFIG